MRMGVWVEWCWAGGWDAGEGFPGEKKNEEAVGGLCAPWCRQVCGGEWAHCHKKKARYTHMCLAGASEVGTAAIDERNIRRRVYDALNVVMALGIIRKEKREIVWCGWPQVGTLVFLRTCMEYSGNVATALGITC